MSNAAKLRKKAAEFEGLKQLDRAISLYASAIQESEAAGEEVDVTLLNKVGDLTLRQGRIADAVTYYERAVEHYAAASLFNNAIALCNKILRSAPGRSNVYFTLGRICAKKGLRGDATRNFLEYATRMRQEGRVDEAMRALTEVAALMPELEEVRRLVEEHAVRNGLPMPRTRTPVVTEAQTDASAPPVENQRSASLVFLDVDYESKSAPASAAPPAAPATPDARPRVGGDSLRDIMLFDPTLIDDEEPLHTESLVEQTPESVPTLDGFLTTSDTAFEAPTAERPGSLLDEGDGSADDAARGAQIEDTDDFVPVFDALPMLDERREPDSIESRPDAVSADAASEDTAATDFVAESSPTVPASGERAESEPLAWIVPPELDAEDSGAFERADESVAPSETESPERVEPVEGLTSRPVTPPDSRPLDGFEATLEADPLSGEYPAESEEELEPTAAAEGFVEPGAITPLDVEPIPELDDAIRAGSEASARGAELPAIARPAFRLESHAFEAEGELPPMVLADSVVRAGLPVVAAPVRSTPSVPIAAVVAEANVVAVSRKNVLREAVAAAPRDWMLRRRLAEALFEAGERGAALAELETALSGLAEDGDHRSAADIADELVRVAGDQVPYHQRRVEMAVRLQDAARLRLAYLDLADALGQGGDEGRARAVYARVLEMDPWDDRARSALGAAAPPPPSAAAVVRDDYVDLKSWLRDDGDEGSTRMRMREPSVSGDEQADFDELLRHFKEGVARSLGEEDFESHYDLGVAYKEMGLLDDAIAEFQKALRSRAHRLPAYEALGQCFVEQERFQVAATVLSRALHEPGLTDEQRVGVLYLLAYSSEALERWSEARSYYQRVYATDIHFRDVASRLAALDQPR